MAGIFGTQGIWQCGFDYFGTGTSQIVSGGIFDLVSNPGNTNCSASFARFSGKGVQIAGAAYLQRTFSTNLQTVICGFAYNPATVPVSGAMGIIAFNDATAGSPQLGLAVTSTSALQFYKTNPMNNASQPSNPIGPITAAGAIASNAYSYIEILVTISSGAGALQVFVNGTQVITFTGATQQTANAWVNQIQLGQGAGANTNTNFDDVYILDVTAPAPLNTFLGPVRIQTDGPNADSATAGLNQWAFTSPQGTDFGNASNIPANAAQYNSDGTVGDRMSFRFPSVTALAFALNMVYSAEIDSAGTRSLVGIFRNNGNDQVGASPGNLNSSYTFYNQTCTIDPNTGQPWSSGPQGAINTCELGLKVNS